MKQLTSNILPRLIIVTGRPGAGKTTLSYRLSHAIRCPLISRDEIKEGLVNTLEKHESSDLDLNKHVYETYFDVIDYLLNQRITLVAEAAFQHKIWLPKLTKLQSRANIKLVICHIEPELSKTRFIERGQSDVSRAKFHDDLDIDENTDISTTLLGQYQSPQLDVPTLTVNTTDGYQPSIEGIISFIQDTSA